MAAKRTRDPDPAAFDGMPLKVRRDLIAETYYIHGLEAARWLADHLSVDFDGCIETIRLRRVN